MRPSPVRYSDRLGRRIRQDQIGTLGISTQTLFEQTVDMGEAEVARDLLDYFFDEMHRMTEALFIWLSDILEWRLARWGVSDPESRAGPLVAGLRGFDPSSGDRRRAHALIASGDAQRAIVSAEFMRIRYASYHDALVAWIQEVLADIAREFGEDAVLDVVERAYHNLWKPRYAQWEEMTPEERLQLSVEGMRGHLSGTRRRGDVGIIDEGDRYVMVLDPCGSCGVLRRGDPESGRSAADPAGNREPHPWTWGRTGVGWYAVHSPIVMEYLRVRDGHPPMRPLEDCDTDLPCRWFIYKDPGATRAEHYERMGFDPPLRSGPDGLMGRR